MALMTQNDFKETRAILDNSVKTLKKFGYDIYKDFLAIIGDDTSFDVYVRSLAEGLNDELKEEFMQLAPTLRMAILENSIYSFSPQAMLIMPIFRKFWPKLVSRAVFNVISLDTPRTMKPFLLPKAKLWGGTEVSLPSLNTIVSAGPTIGTVDAPLTVSLPNSFDLLNAVGLTSDVAHVERDLKIVGWEGIDPSGASTSGTVDVRVDDMGNFSFEVDFGGGIKDVVTGHVDFYNGILQVSSIRDAETNGKVTAIKIAGNVSLEENAINAQVEWSFEYLELIVKDFKISANWSVEFSQDIKAYFDLDAQSRFVSTIANQIAVDIDNYLLNKEVLSKVELTYPTGSSHRDTFAKNPPAGYTLGPKYWLDNIVVKLNELSAAIYNDTLIGGANCIVCNPVTASYLKSTQTYEFKGNIEGGAMGAVPYEGTLNDQWAVYTTPVMPQDKILLLHKGETEDKATFIYGIYRPVTLMPYPLGNKVSLTVMSRFASTWVRIEGAALLTLTS